MHSNDFDSVDSDSQSQNLEKRTVILVPFVYNFKMKSLFHFPEMHKTGPLSPYSEE